MKTFRAGAPDEAICILGMGFVGLTLSAVMARVGFEVTGVDIRRDLVRQLSAGQAHFFEPGLTEQLSAAVHSGRLCIYETIPEDCGASIYIICVGTPLGPDRRVDLTSISNISQQIARRLKDGDLVILRSTVRIGVTRRVVAPILQSSGKRFDLAFCPERTIEGQAMAELPILPQIIGANDLDGGIRAGRLFQRVTPTIVRVGDTETAEMIKLIDNSARDLMFAYANEVAQMCDAVGISADDVIRFGRFGYSRTKLPKPGPVGGPCLSKDPYILCESLEPFGVDPLLTRTARRVNDRLPSEIGRKIGHWLRSRGSAGRLTVAILGVAFKGRPSTDDVRGTTVGAVRHALGSEFPDAMFRGYDPVVKPEAIAALGLDPVPSLERAFLGADLVVVHTDHADFALMPVGQLSASMRKPALIYDFWNLFTEAGLVLPEHVTYMALGSHSRPLTGAAGVSPARGFERNK